MNGTKRQLSSTHSLKLVWSPWYLRSTLLNFMPILDNASIPAFGLSNDVPEELDLSTCLTLTNKWMKKCDEEHRSCSQPPTSKLPTRLLDLGLNSNTDVIYLKET